MPLRTCLMPMRDGHLPIAHHCRNTTAMSGESGGIWKKLFKKEKASEALSGGGTILSQMPPGPLMTLCLIYGRGADDTIADNGLALALDFLTTHKLRASFACGAKLAEMAPVALSK